MPSTVISGSVAQHRRPTQAEYDRFHARAGINLEVRDSRLLCREDNECKYILDQIGMGLHRRRVQCAASRSSAGRTFRSVLDGSSIGAQQNEGVFTPCRFRAQGQESILSHRNRNTVGELTTFFRSMVRSVLFALRTEDRGLDPSPHIGSCHILTRMEEKH